MPTYSTVNNFSYEFPCALFGRVILYLQMNDTMNTTNTNADLNPQDASYAMAFVSSNEDCNAAYDGAGFSGCGDGSGDLADYNADEADDYTNEGSDYANDGDDDADEGDDYYDVREDFGWAGDENLRGE